VVYTFVIYDPSTNCYYFQKASGPVAPITTLTSTAPIAIPVTCNGSNDGSVKITINNYDATSVKYEIFYAQSTTSTGITGTVGTAPQTFTSPAGLKPGTYYIKFTEVGGTRDQCTSSSATFVITESAVLLTLNASSPKNDNCKTNAGQVVAVPSGGTGPYLYQIVPDNGAIGFGLGDTQPTSISFVSPTHKASTFNVESGNYIVWVKDANGCIKNATSTVALDPDPVFALAVPNKCATEGNFAVNVTVTDAVPTMAPYTISVNAGTFVSFSGLTYSATGLNSGPQTIVIENKNGCPVTHSIAITPTPLATAVVSKPLDCSVSSTAVANATITVTIKEGTSPYTYEVKQGSLAYSTITPTVTVVAGVTTFSYSVPSANADTYLFRITDSNTCPIVTNPVVIDPIVPIVPAYNIIKPLCKGDSGTIELSATGGKGPYTYSFNSSSFTTITVYSAIAGTYPYIVRDALGCEKTGSAILGEPTAVVLGTPVITPLTCGPSNVGQAATVDLSLVASGGTGTFEYSFANSAFSGQKIYTVNDNLADQLNIPYKVRDVNGCEKSGTVNIYKLNPPTNFGFTPGPVITCATLSTTVEIINVVNAVGPMATGLTYQIISPTVVDNNTNPKFTNLAPGNYVFQVTEATTGCVKQLPYEIKDVIKINIVEQSTTGITCSTAADGKASFFVSGFASTATYRYELDGVAVPGNLSSSTINLIGLAKGPHTIKVIDNATTCPKLINFVIDAPTAALVALKEVTPLGCTTFGAVKITATGGWGSYEYTVKQPNNALLTNNTGVFGGLTQTGLYSISIKDANGCVITDSFNFVTPTNPTAAIAATSDFCYDTVNGATLVVNASLGVAPYLFSIDNGNTFSPSNTLPTPNATYSFKNLAPGSYDIVVKDAYGCESTVALNRVIEPQLFATAQNTKDIFCTGTVNGTIKIDAVGGYGSYTYTVAKDLGTPIAPVAFPVGSKTANYTVTAPGSYVFVVYDAKGCSYTITNAVVMVAPTPVTFTATPTSPSCIGTQGNVGNGSILVTLAAANDNPDYTYTIARTAPTAGSLKTQINNGLFTGLIAGTYAVTVTSARGCVTPDTVIINNPNPVVASASASPFTCSVTNTLNETTVTVRGTGGSGTGAVLDYTYSEDGINWKTTNTFKVFDNGSAQNPTYYVKDANGCIDDVQIPIAAFPKLISATPSLVTKGACNNLGEVIKVDIVGGALPANFEYQVAVDGGAFGAVKIPIVLNSFNYTAPTAGHSYQFKITDLTTTCSILSTAYEVPLFNTIKVIASTAANVSCNGGKNGAIEINIVDYKGPYTYEILKGGVSLVPAVTGIGNSNTTNPLVLNPVLAAGIYTVSVLETAYPNCPATSDVVEITEPAVLSLSTAITVVNQNCNNFGAVITIPSTSVVGGTLGYTYAFVPSGALPLGKYTPSNTKTIVTGQINPLFDAIDVWVQDANGCTDMQTVQITRDPLPVITKVVATQCPSTTDTYDITVTASGFSALEYSLDGNSFQSDNVLKVSSPGNYTVTVRDANLCTTNVNGGVTILKPLGLKGDVTKVRSCSVANDGEITLTAFEGSGLPNYQYSIGTGPYGASNVFSGLAAGTYTMNVKDNSTSCVKSIEVIIDAPTVVTVQSIKAINVSCSGSRDGSITVTLEPSTLTINNNPDYKYSLVRNPLPVGTPVTISNQSSNVFDNLEAGSYTVTTTSARGCTDIQTISVGSPAPIVVPAPDVVQYACSTVPLSNTMNFATITVNTPSGGSGTYTNYEFVKLGLVVQSGKSNVYIQTDMSGGTFTINVNDDKGCVGTTVATIDPFVSIDFAASKIAVTKSITCVNDEEIKVNVKTTGVTVPMPTLVYNVKGISVGSIYNVTDPTATGVFTGLTVGNYLVTVTNTVTGCAIQTVHYVNEPNTFELQVVNKSDVKCYGSNEGSVELTFVDRSPLPSDESGPYSYVIKDASGAIVQSGTSTNTAPKLITGLKAGIYSVTATLTGLTSPQCTTSLKNFTINQPIQALAISESHTVITCKSANYDNGTISASAVGGWLGDYLFQLVETISGTATPWGSTTDFTGLKAGNYIVKVKDSKMCEAQVPVILVNPTPIAATITAVNQTLTCFEDTNATITVVQPVTGGSGTYNYTLEATYPNGTVTLDGPYSSNVFTNLGAASYKVIVSDTWGCSTDSNTIVITQPTIVTASLVQTSAQTCVTPATVTLSAVGGNGSYTYSTDPNFTVVLGTFASSTLVTVPFTTVALNPIYYVKDSNGCVSYASNSVPVTPLEPLDFKFENDTPRLNCLGDTNGQITVIATGGSGNYVYTLLNSTSNPISSTPLQSTPGYFTNLAAGNYFVDVTSGDCTVGRKSITISAPSSQLKVTPTVSNVTCNGDGNGKLEITASGGSPAIIYALSPELNKFVTTSDFINLVPGDYTAITQDLRGCNEVHRFTITEPSPISAKVDLLTVKQELCAGEKTGEFGIVIAPGSGTAPYSTSLDDPKGTFVLNKVLFKGLTGGNHTVYVKDANLCIFELVVALDPSVDLDPIATPTYDCVNDLPANKVTVTIDDSNNSADVLYSLDNSPTTQIGNVFINVAPGDHFVMAHHKNGCVEATSVFNVKQIEPLAISIDLGGLNEIVATATGGSGVYRYSVNGEDIGSNNKYIYYKSGDYTVTVTDSNGCVAAVTKYFEFIDIEIPNVFTPNGSGTNDNWHPTKTENYPDIQFVVYDRYGRIVGTFGAGQSWDGNYNGTELPMGDYWYILKLRNTKDDREFIGHFTLYR
jgi:gliding motility-associated-like protein